MTGALTVRTVATAALLVALALMPLYAQASGNFFVLTLFTRIVILALAAVSLNLILVMRHDELRPRCLSRHRRLRGRHAGA